MQARTLIGVYHFVWGAWCVDLGRGGLGGTGVSSSGIITTAFFAFSSLAPSSVDPLSPQRTLKMKETPLSDRRPQRSKHVGGTPASVIRWMGILISSSFSSEFYWVPNHSLLFACVYVWGCMYACSCVFEFICVWRPEISYSSGALHHVFWDKVTHGDRELVH